MECAWVTGLVSGGIGLLGVIVGFGLSVIHVWYKEFRTRKNTASAIKSEIENIFVLARTSSLQNFIESGYQTHEFSVMHMNFNYFIVFENNADLISLLGSALAGRLIEFYNHAKQIVDQRRVYDDLVFNQRPDRERRDTFESIRTNWNRINDLRRQIDPEIERIERERFLYLFR